MSLIIYKTNCFTSKAAAGIILAAGLDAVYLYTGLLMMEAGDLPGFFMSYAMYILL